MSELSAATDPIGHFKTSDQRSENASGRDRASAANDENRERKDTSEQLCQDLDRMLRSAKIVARHEICLHCWPRSQARLPGVSLRVTNNRFAVSARSTWDNAWG